MSVNLQRGGNISLTKAAPGLQNVAIGLGWHTTTTAGSEIDMDASAFLLTKAGKVPADDYFVYYNNLQSPHGAVQHQGDNVAGAEDDEIIMVNLALVDPHIEKINFTVTIYQPEQRKQNFSMVQNAFIRVVNPADNTELARYELRERFTTETAMIFGELYRYQTEWKFRAVGQGFAGGLGALVTTFGLSLADEPSPPPPPPPPQNKKQLSLEKRLAEKAPHLLDLTKKAQVSLEKANLSGHRAKVALCLDISGSMTSLYSSGKVQKLAERILALACRFDDDGAIDIFLFGSKAYNAGEMSVDNFSDFTQQMLQKYPLEYATYYGQVMHMIRLAYFAEADKREAPLTGPQPVYVMFVTDGIPSDKEEAMEQLRLSSYEPIFWQFMAIGASNKTVQPQSGGITGWLQRTFVSGTGVDFAFLEKLDTLHGRHIDNSNFFSVEDPQAIPDEQLYDLLMAEYPDWVRQARERGLVG